jgi:hypothetical protein
MVRLWGKNYSTFWKIRPPPKKKKILRHQHSSFGELGVGAPANFESFAPLKKRTGLRHCNGLDLMKDLLGTSGVKEGAAGAVDDSA